MTRRRVGKGLLKMFCHVRLSLVRTEVKDSLFFNTTLKDGSPLQKAKTQLSEFNNIQYILDMATYLTQEGYDKKMKELSELEAQRPMIKQAIAEARDKGDLSENAEYDAAKEAQGMLEMKISKIKELIASARIIDDSKLNTEIVQLLNKVTIKNVKTGMTVTYTIVTENEANLREGKISSNTPIAQGLMGHKVGDVVKVNAPVGVLEFEILKIEI